MNKYFTYFLTSLAFLLTVTTAATGQWLAAVAMFSLYSCAVNPVKARLCAVTLSVPELLKDILEAFKVATPELFSPSGFAKDYSSQTAVLGTKLISKLAHVPVTADYDPTPGVGFY